MDLNEVEVLLVEDNSTDAELTIRSLRNNHLANRLYWVKDGAEAVEFIFGEGQYAGRNPSRQPKVILLDLRLPKLDGMDVLKKIKSDERTRHIPVVILTSSQEDQDIARSYALGVNSYVSKPVEFDEFVKAVSSLGMYWLLLNKNRI